MMSGSSQKLLWEILERYSGVACIYDEAEIRPVDGVVYLPPARAAFLREWPGSSNPRTRMATYGRVLKSIASAGGFVRLERVPLQSHRNADLIRKSIQTRDGQSVLLPKERLSPFIALKGSPVLEAVEAKTAELCGFCGAHKSCLCQNPLESVSVVSTPVTSIGERCYPVSVIEY